MRNFLGYFFLLCFSLDFSLCSIQDYYCGYKNCYKILNVTKESTIQDIKKSYRALSKIYHPDKSRAKGLNDTTDIFKEINQAYDVLNNAEVRASYDEYLNDPDKGDAYHYYNYYKASYLPQTDPKMVISAILLAFSIIQYVIRKGMYEQAITCIERTSKFKTALNQKFQEENKKRSKEEIRIEMKKTIKVEGGYSEPKVLDLLIFQLLLIPIKIVQFMSFYIRWFYKFTLKKEPFGDYEKEYITQSKLGLSEKQWNNMLTEEQRDDYMSLNLWDQKEFQNYIEEQNRIKEEKMGSSAKYKQYKRYLKNKKF